MEVDSLFHGLVFRQVQSLRNDGVGAPEGAPILQQYTDMARAQHCLFDGHLKAGQSGL